MSGRAWLLAAMAVAVVALAIGLLLMARPSDQPPPMSRPRDAVAVTTGSATTTPPVPVRDATIAPPLLDAESSWTAEQRAARADREQMMASLHQSGSGQEPWVGSGLAALGVLASMPGVATSDEGCYVAGCGAVFTFGSETDYRRAIDALLVSDAFRAWTGGKRFAPPERLPDGRVVVAIGLYRPD